MVREVLEGLRAVVVVGWSGRLELLWWFWGSATSRSVARLGDGSVGRGYCVVVGRRGE